MTSTSANGSQQVSFTFEGRRIRARKGQSIASAILASGTTVLTRSFKYRRPRGYTCGYDACGNCPVTINGLPGVTACTTPVRGGETVRRERGWPSADRDVMRVADLMSRFLPAGFQFRLFRSQPRLAHLAEKVMAHVAGAGRFPTAEAAAAFRTTTETSTPDVLVVGGGLSGCAAALGAAEGGATVLLAHRGKLGGRANGRIATTTYAGQQAPSSTVAERLAVQVLEHPGIEVVDGTAMSYFEGGVVPVVAGSRLLEVHAERLVAATGSYDVPALFPGNDKPGVVLADGVSKLLWVDRVVPWQRAVVLTDCERGADLARQLEKAGVDVVALVDQSGAGAAGDHPRGLRGSVISARGFKTLRAVDVQVDGAVRTVSADLLCVALRERPADELVLQWQYVTAGTTTEVPGGWSPPESAVPGLTVVGSAAGWIQDDPDRARAAGEAACASMRKQ